MAPKPHERVSKSDSVQYQPTVSINQLIFIAGILGEG
jgi:hypothetical protein